MTLTQAGNTAAAQAGVTPAYVVDGDEWAGTGDALGRVCGLRLPVLLKFLALVYADSPRTVMAAAAITGLTVVETEDLTAELIDRGLVAEWTALVPRRPSWARVRRQVFERDGEACRHCGAAVDLTIDHIHPRSAGGDDSLENLQVLCRPCNSRKGARVG